ncbi:MAG: hypothetical protein WEA99_01050 [Brumimicrobium sp.]
MHHKSHYSTVSEAISKLRSDGFDTDFNLEENCLVCGDDKFKTDELEIVDVYRYEGESDPGDEATVYGIESQSGVKGILVIGSGSSVDSRMVETLKQLKIRKA